MHRIGYVLHASSNRNLILRAIRTPKIGDEVVNKEAEHVGKISEIFGPTSSPYVAVKADVENPQRFVSQILYAISPFKIRKERRK